MNNTKVSIIVPVYNSESYVAEAVESLMNQTFKNIEIILVNDGSTDDSGKICAEYQLKDERIIVINKENGGQASARNEGMKIAKGKYIMFLDADDMYDPNACEIMYNMAEENQADYVNANYIMTDADGTKWPKPAFDVEKYQDFKLDINDYKKSFFVMNGTPWNKIYRKDFLNENNINFGIPAPAEDAYFTSLCYMKAKCGFYTNKVIYLYRNAPSSTSRNCSLKYFRGINYAYKKIYESFKENKKLGYYRYAYAKTNAYIVCQLIDSNQITDEEKIEWLKEFKWYFELREKLKVNTVHESLRKVMQLIKEEDYSKLIIEMNKLQAYRKSVPDTEKKRMSFPTQENYAEMAQYDKDFE